MPNSYLSLRRRSYGPIFQTFWKKSIHRLQPVIMKSLHLAQQTLIPWIVCSASMSPTRTFPKAELALQIRKREQPLFWCMTSFWANTTVPNCIERAQILLGLLLRVPATSFPRRAAVVYVQVSPIECKVHHLNLISSSWKEMLGWKLMQISNWKRNFWNQISNF